MKTEEIPYDLVLEYLRFQVRRWFEDHPELEMWLIEAPPWLSWIYTVLTGLAVIPLQVLSAATVRREVKCWFERDRRGRLWICREFVEEDAGEQIRRLDEIMQQAIAGMGIPEDLLGRCYSACRHDMYYTEPGSGMKAPLIARY